MQSLYNEVETESAYEAGETYHVRLTTSYESGTTWTSAGTGGFCSFMGGEWLDSDGDTHIVTQDACTVSTAKEDEDAAEGTIVGATMTVGDATAVLNDMTLTLTWSDGDEWTLSSGMAQRIRAYIDDELVVDVTDNSIVSGAVGFATYHATMQAFGVQMHDVATEANKYGQLSGHATSSGLMNIYVDGELYAESVDADGLANVRMLEDYETLAISVEQVSMAASDENSESGIGETAVWSMGDDEVVVMDGDDQTTYDSEMGVNRFATDGFTVMIWAKRTVAVSDWARIIGKGDSTNRNYGLWLHPNGNALAQIYGISSSNAWTNAGGDDNCAIDTWCHMTLRFDEDHTLALFVNGILIQQTGVMSDYSPNNDDDDMTLGAAGVGVDRFHTYFKGEVKGGAIYDSGLSTAQITTLAGMETTTTDSAYTIVAESKNYDDASEYCQLLGKELLTLYSSSVEDDLRANMNSNHFWIGFQDIASEGTWVWDDNEQGTSSYTNWWPGEPNNAGNEDCTMVYWHVDGWNDAKCSNSYHFACGPEYDTMYELGISASLTSSTPSSLGGDTPSSEDIITADGDNGWKCSVSAPDDSTFEKLSDNHPTVGTAPSAGDCTNGNADADACSEYCASLDGCTGFWYYIGGASAGRCCPKASWTAGSFEREIPDGAFYRLSGIKWYEPAYAGKDDWADPDFVEVDESAAFSAHVEYIGLETTSTDSASDITATGYLYCVYDKPVAAAADASELIVGGGFEEPVATSWQMAYSYSSADIMPPGWTVTSGNVDWGKYQTGGHCTGDCAAEGVQQIDLCGGSQGGIEQTVTTVADKVYELNFKVNAHGGCGDDLKSTNVYIDGELLASIDKDRCGGWAGYANCWSQETLAVTAAGDTTTIKFESVDNSCGCMTLDDVSFMLNE